MAKDYEIDFSKIKNETLKNYHSKRNFENEITYKRIAKYLNKDINIRSFEERDSLLETVKNSKYFDQSFKEILIGLIFSENEDEVNKYIKKIKDYQRNKNKEIQQDPILSRTIDYINGNTLRKRSKDYSDFPDFNKKKINWEESQMLLCALFELLEISGFVASGTFENLGSIVSKHFSIHDGTKEITRKSFNNHKSNEYNDTRWDHLSELITRLSETYDKMQKNKEIF